VRGSGPVPRGYGDGMSETTPEPVTEPDERVQAAATPDDPAAERAQEGVQEAFE
jgi:hypothetical protein